MRIFPNDKQAVVFIDKWRSFIDVLIVYLDDLAMYILYNAAPF
jgi:hypothetical protein